MNTKEATNKSLKRLISSCSQVSFTTESHVFQEQVKCINDSTLTQSFEYKLLWRIFRCIFQDIWALTYCRMEFLIDHFRYKYTFRSYFFQNSLEIGIKYNITSIPGGVMPKTVCMYRQLALEISRSSLESQLNVCKVRMIVILKFQFKFDVHYFTNSFRYNFLSEERI